MDIIKQNLTYPQRMSRRQRETLRMAIIDENAKAVFCDRVASVIDAQSGSDPAELEDTFIFGAEIADILRQSVELEIREATMHAAAFFFGFTGQPMARLFEANVMEAIVQRHIPETNTSLKAPSVTRTSDKKLTREIQNKAGTADLTSAHHETLGFYVSGFH